MPRDCYSNTLSDDDNATMLFSTKEKRMANNIRTQISQGITDNQVIKNEKEAAFLVYAHTRFIHKVIVIAIVCTLIIGTLSFLAVHTNVISDFIDEICPRYYLL
jgi:hypothetical protein